MMTDLPIRADLLIHGAALVATVDDDRRELAGGWVAITDGLISGVGGSTDPMPDAERIIDAGGCLVTPGLVNTHHHLFQNLTRAYPPMTSAPLFGWLQSLYPLWTAAIDEEAEYLAAWVGLAELALSGCTTSSDHHYLHPVRAGDLLGAEIQAAVDLGMRFHPTYASMSVGESAGGLPPDDAVRVEDDILAESQRAVERHHDRSHGAMVRVALAPCSPFSVSEDLMIRSAELAERLDVRLHRSVTPLRHRRRPTSCTGSKTTERETCSPNSFRRTRAHPQSRSVYRASIRGQRRRRAPSTPGNEAQILAMPRANRR